MAHGGKQEVRLTLLLRQGHEETKNFPIPCNAARKPLIGRRAAMSLSLRETGVSS